MDVYGDCEGLDADISGTVAPPRLSDEKTKKQHLQHQLFTSQIQEPAGSSAPRLKRPRSSSAVLEGEPAPPGRKASKTTEETRRKGVV